AQAPVSVLEKTFGTQLSVFRDRAGGQGRDLVAPASPVTIPASLRGAVSAVLGLDDSATTITPQYTTAAAPQAAQVQHCARWWGETNNADVPQKYPVGAQSNSLCG